MNTYRFFGSNNEDDRVELIFEWDYATGQFVLGVWEASDEGNDDGNYIEMDTSRARELAQMILAATENR